MPKQTNMEKLTEPLTSKHNYRYLALSKWNDDVQAWKMSEFLMCIYIYIDLSIWICTFGGRCRFRNLWWWQRREKTWDKFCGVSSAVSWFDPIMTPKKLMYILQVCFIEKKRRFQCNLRYDWTMLVVIWNLVNIWCVSEKNIQISINILYILESITFIWCHSRSFCRWYK